MDLTGAEDIRRAGKNSQNYINLSLMLGKIEGRRRRGRQRMKGLACCGSWGRRVDTTERLN